MVAKPPRLFLDTSHLINISNLRLGKFLRRPQSADAYQRISDYITNYHFGLVFDPFSALEWVDKNATLETAIEIANVIDSAKLRYEFAGDTFAYQAEIIAELRRIDSSLQLPDFDVIWPCEAGTYPRLPIVELFKFNPELFGVEKENADGMPPPEKWKSISARVHVENAWKFKHRNPTAFRERVEGHRDAYLRDATEFKQRKTKIITNAELRDWMKRFLKMESIIKSHNANAKVDELLDAIKLDHCPAIFLYANAHVKRILASNVPKDSDVGDWSTVPIVPHCDLFLTEKNLGGFLHQADRSLSRRVVSAPAEAVAILG